MLIAFTGTSAKTLYATVKRLVDGYYLHNSSLTFVSAPTFTNKRLTLTEGSAEELGYYSYSVVSTTWNDGLYEVKIHDGDNSNIVIGGAEIAMMNGVETTLGNEVAIYHADINFVKDGVNSDDEYLISVFKNGAQLTTSLTNPTITVIDQNGTFLILAAAVTEYATGKYHYTALTTQRQTVGEMYNVAFNATNGSDTISFSWNLGRDTT